MIDEFIWLYYLSSLTGMIMIAGGICLLYKQKIYIDSQTHEATTIETPVGKFRTNAPALALFLIGFIPLIYPIYQSSRKDRQVLVQGKISGGRIPVQVYVILESQSLFDEGIYRFNVPAHSDRGQYKLLYMANGDILEEKEADLNSASGGRIDLDELIIHNLKTNNYQPQLQPVPKEFSN